MFENYSADALQVLASAQSEARRLRQRQTQTPHLMIALLLDGGPIVTKTLRDYHVTVELVREIAEMGPRASGSPSKNPDYSVGCLELFEVAEKWRVDLESSQVEPEHLLLALLNRTERTVVVMMINNRVSILRLRDKIIELARSKAKENHV